ncbi:MAG: inorganic phosphate transporter [Planctomycetes bacterium]|nr:inorganic phosphate transporter [Planctomycetota bacterium]
MGTSVGSGALTLRQALVIAAIAEFAGAFLVGTHVAQTMEGGIVEPSFFAGDPMQLVCGMLAALLASSIWVHLATFFGQPISTSHSIVGAVCGFGLVVGAPIKWDMMGGIFASWILSPVAGLICGYALFRFLARRILGVERPSQAAGRIAPWLVFLVIAILVLSFIYKGLKNLHLDLSLPVAAGIAVGAGAGMAAVAWILIRIFGRRVEGQGVEAELTHVERIFRYLQLLTAGYVAFAHGANDVANSVGPMAAIIHTFAGQSVSSDVQVPWWILAIGGAGIVLGLGTYGWRVIRTIGTEITDLTPSRGFAAQFATATTVLACSKMGFPISTSHTIVGAVLGVALARGIGSMNTRVVRDIFICWVVTVPISAFLSILCYVILRALV